ncbi:uracil-DNA glycosylase [Caballeronia telluris]|uniref:Type-4 uracil-DNA glycosylase n=1 Tax=Caballeronia telluris TaxID=326475 RepID=A0A158HHR6_9BURK|nr:uracil-DNA glycosylase [Caballeronia telluris]SAL43894.1 phage SPO1 DNA polymerase--like protein [Caballeronia telluris]
MALHESMLEEFGLGPVWVRRRAGGRSSDAPVAAEAVLPRAESAGAAEAKTARDAQRPQTPAVDAAPAPVREPPRADFAAESRNEAEPFEPQSSDRPSAAHDADDLPWLDEAPAPADAYAVVDAPADIHTLDWDTLAARVANCERCRLCERRTNTVFGVGDREADWMLIGEAPGENEDKLGEPFVGQAGRLLDSMLRAVALSRESNVYIANVIKCRPPGNRNPELDEVARCEPYLQRQVALVKPKVIVALGRFAAQSLLKTEASIASLRGRVHRYEGVPVIVTYHPAYLLRSLPDKAKAWADLCLARETYRASLDASGVVPGGQ